MYRDQHDPISSEEATQRKQVTCCYERHYATNGDFQDFCPPCQDAAQTHKAKLEAFEKQYKDKWPSSLQPKERGNPKPATRAMWDLIKQMQIHCTYQEKKEKRRTSQPKPYEPSEQVSQGRRHSIGGGDHETREAVYMNALEVLTYLLTCLLTYLLTYLPNRRSRARWTSS